MVRLKNLEARTRGTSKIEISAWGRAGILVELFGEFDVRDLSTLRKVLGIVLKARLPAHLDLSKVTFLDVRCAWELAELASLYDYLMLRDSSWECKASLKACGREACIANSPRERPLLRELRPAQIHEHANIECSERSTLAV
jgi:hypothetical protein